MTWAISISDSAFRQLNKIRDSPKFQLFDEAIRELAESDNSSALSRFKKVSGIRCYAYNVTKSFRLLYSVDRENHTVIIRSIGDHKQAYGKD